MERASVWFFILGKQLPTNRTGSLHAVLLASKTHIHNFVRYRMPPVVGAGIHGVDMVGTTANGELLDQAETHVYMCGKV